MHLVYVSVSKPEIPIIKLLSNVIKLRENVAINFFLKIYVSNKDNLSVTEIQCAGTSFVAM